MQPDAIKFSWNYVRYIISVIITRYKISKATDINNLTAKCTTVIKGAYIVHRLLPFMEVGTCKFSCFHTPVRDT
jgi:hypothetical protein